MRIALAMTDQSTIFRQPERRRHSIGRQRRRAFDAVHQHLPIAPGACQEVAPAAK
jgi:hypothetical protein